MGAADSVSDAKGAIQRFKQDPTRREQAQRRVRNYLNLPVVLAAVLIVLLALPWLTGHPGRVWHGGPVAILFAIWALLVLEFAVKFALAPDKSRFLHHHWWELLIALVPVIGIVRLAIAIRQLTDNDSAVTPHLAILQKRHLDKLAIISALVVFIGAALVLLFEDGAHGTTITGFGVALYWSAALITTVASQLYPVTPGGQVVSLLLMFYSVAFFTYLTSALASALIGGDAQQASAQAQHSAGQTDQTPQTNGAQATRAQEVPLGLAVQRNDGSYQLRLSAAELALLRIIVGRASVDTDE